MIIGISSKIKGGKDLVGEIIQYLTSNYYKTGYNFDYFKQQNSKRNDYPLYLDWQIKKYADKLKDIVCILIGCTRKQLEDREFKETELGEEWNYIRFLNGELIDAKDRPDLKFQKFTPRLLMQLIGTECGRQIIHPNIWVNATMTEYKPYTIITGTQPDVNSIHLKERLSNWIITDVRFPNEAKAITDKGGIIIRIERPLKFRFPNEWKEWLLFREENTLKKYNDFNDFLKDYDFELYKILNHESETGLDDYQNFDYIIHSITNSKDDLIQQVKNILIKEGIIQ